MQLKNWFQSKPYWIKGGMIGVIIAVLSYFVAPVPLLGLLSVLLIFPTLIALLIISKIFGSGNSLVFTEATENNLGLSTTIFGKIVLIFVVLSMYFLIGAVIGFLIGKIKSVLQK